jgi:Tol biopolymer transport system component
MAPDGTRRRELTHNDAEDYAPLWSPDGSQIAFVSNRDGGLGLYIMNADGSQQHRLTNKEGHADWSSDGKNIAIADGGIYVLDLTTGGEQLLVQGEADHPTWSPDGKLMAFVIQTQGECQMHVIRIGAGVEIVPPVASDCTKPAWAPDSSRLAFALRSAKHGPAGRLFVLDVRTRGNLILTDEHQWLGDGLVWSLLGSQIFYPADGEIFVAQADGRGQSQLTSLGRSLLAFVNVHNLALSPDGKRIVFARNEDKNNTADNARLWIINTDGSGSRKLSP